MPKKKDECEHGSPKCQDCIRREQDAALLAEDTPIEVQRIARTDVEKRLDIPDKP